MSIDISELTKYTPYGKIDCSLSYLELDES